MTKLSRAKIAGYFADEIAIGRTDVSERLASLLVAEHRTDELDLIVADIEYELAERGIVYADVFTANGASDGVEAAIRTLLDVKDSDRLILREHLDPGLIGGIKIRAAGRELDATVKHKLNTLKGAL